MSKLFLAAVVASLVLAPPIAASAAHRHAAHAMHGMHQMMVMVNGHMAPVFVMMNGHMEPVFVGAQYTNGG